MNCLFCLDFFITKIQFFARQQGNDNHSVLLSTTTTRSRIQKRDFKYVLRLFQSFTKEHFAN